MKKIVPLLVLAAIGSGGWNMGRAQSLEERLQKYGVDFAKGYTKPLIDAFGAGLNSGWIQTANVDDGLDLFFGVKAMLMPIPDDGKKFMIASPYNGVVQEVPTVFGEEVEKPISGYPGAPASPDKYPNGFNVGFAPLAVPHISIGNIFGTRVMLRYFPKTKFGDLGEFEFFGIGVQHSISRYLPLVPVDLAANVAFQNMKLGSLVSASAFTFGAQASKSFSILTVYGGLAYETSSLSFSYNGQASPPGGGAPVPIRVSFDQNGKNNFRLTGGIGLSLAIIKIVADYSIASQPAATVGVGIGW